MEMKGRRGFFAANPSLRLLLLQIVNKSPNLIAADIAERLRRRSPHQCKRLNRRMVQRELVKLRRSAKEPTTSE